MQELMEGCQRRERQAPFVFRNRRKKRLALLSVCCYFPAINDQRDSDTAERLAPSLVEFGEGTRGDAVPLLRHLGPAELKGDICLLRRNKFYLPVVSVFL